MRNEDKQEQARQYGIYAHEAFDREAQVMRQKVEIDKQVMSRIALDVLAGFAAVAVIGYMFWVAL